MTLRLSTCRIVLLAVLGLIALASPSAAQDKFLLPEGTLQTFRDCPTCPEMVVLPNGVAMSRTPVTKGEFAVFSRDRSFQQEDWGCTWTHTELPQTDAHPVVCISWTDAATYVEWLSARTGKAYRLPTVDDMKYAVMAGETGPYWWGQDIGKARANCRGCGSKWDGKSTAPVNSFKPNRFGVADAVGNVWIWTQTCHAADCNDRMLIGGAWSSAPGDLRATRQIWNGLGLRFNTYGMRVVRDGV